MDPTTKTAPEVMLNENNQRETVTRILHDFVMLKLANDNTSLGQLKVLLEDSVKKIMRVFEDDLSEYRQMLLAMEGSGYGRMREALEDAGYSPDEDGILALLDEAKPRPTD